MLGARERVLGQGCWQLGLRGARGHVVWRQRWSLVLQEGRLRDLQASGWLGQPRRGPHEAGAGCVQRLGAPQRLGDSGPRGQSIFLAAWASLGQRGQWGEVAWGPQLQQRLLGRDDAGAEPGDCGEWGLGVRLEMMGAAEPWGA